MPAVAALADCLPSCHTGYRKPEPGAYLVADRALSVEPGECLFVGAGGSYELPGATALGMSAIHFIPPGESRGESIDEDADWLGDVIWTQMNVVPC